MSTIVGEFTYADGVVSGPAEYMRERGNDRIERILEGSCSVFNAGARFSAGVGVATLVLTSLQTDYAAWKGLQALVDTCRRLMLSTGHVVNKADWLREWGVSSITDLPPEAR